MAKTPVTDAEAMSAWCSHMEMCMKVIMAPLGNPLAEVTIICRAPGTPPSEAMLSTNAIDALADVRDVIAYAIKQRNN